jgi:hypothetical protein
MSKLDELRKQLADAERAEKEERERLAKSVKPIRQIMIRPTRDAQTYDRVFSPSYKVFRLWCETTNKHELKAVGALEPHDGGMNYAVNIVTWTIVCAMGGGSIYFRDSETAERIGQFLQKNPDGGDITSLMPENSF